MKRVVIAVMLMLAMATPAEAKSSPIFKTSCAKVWRQPFEVKNNCKKWVVVKVEWDYGTDVWNIAPHTYYKAPKPNYGERYIPKGDTVEVWLSKRAFKPDYNADVEIIR